jgi:hypothetical protein
MSNGLPLEGAWREHARAHVHTRMLRLILMWPRNSKYYPATWDPVEESNPQSRRQGLMGGVAVSGRPRNGFRRLPFEKGARGLPLAC